MEKQNFELLNAIVKTDEGADMISDVINKIIDVIGVKNIVVAIPEDESLSGNGCMKDIVYNWLFDELTFPDRNDDGWDAGTENESIVMLRSSREGIIYALGYAGEYELPDGDLAEAIKQTWKEQVALL